MPKEKAKLRVRIRQPHGGSPSSEDSQNVQGSLMSSKKPVSLLQKPALRAGLLIGAALIALLAALLMVMPFESAPNGDVTQQAVDDRPPLAIAKERGEEPFTYPPPIAPDSTAVPDDSAPPPPLDLESAELANGLGESPEPESAGQWANETSSFEALEAQEPLTALRESEAERPVQRSLDVTEPGAREPSSQPAEERIALQPTEVLTPQPSISSEAPSAPIIIAPTHEDIDSTEEASQEVIDSRQPLQTDEHGSPSPVARAQFTHGIVEREPTDRIDSVFYASGEDTDRLYYFTELIGLSGETITHRWEYEGQVIATVDFEIGGNRWRVYSIKTLLPSMLGEWRVVVVDAEGNALHTAEVTYTAGDS